MTLTSHTITKTKSGYTYMCTVYVNKKSPYSTVITQKFKSGLTVIGVLSIEHHSSETIVTILY